MHRENRRVALPDKFPIGHLDEPEKKLLILAGGKRPDRPLYEVATLGALRDRLRSGDIWVEGSRAYRPLDEYLMPTGRLHRKERHRSLEPIGVPGDAPAWLDSNATDAGFFSSSNSPIALASESLRAGVAARGRRIGRIAVGKRGSRRCRGRLNGRAQQLHAQRPHYGFARRVRWLDRVRRQIPHICTARATWCAIAPPFWPPCWPTPPIWGPSAWRKPHPMSANDRLVGRVCFTSGQRLTGRLKQRSSTRIQPIRTPLFGALGATSSSDGQFFRASDPRRRPKRREPP